MSKESKRRHLIEMIRNNNLKIEKLQAINYQLEEQYNKLGQEPKVPTEYERLAQSKKDKESFKKSNQDIIEILRQKANV